MNKFIGTINGQYVNIDQVTGFYIWQDKNGWSVNCFIFLLDNEEREWEMIQGLDSDEDAQEWLDKFMQKHSLCIEPAIQTRCF